MEGVETSQLLEQLDHSSDNSSGLNKLYDHLYVSGNGQPKKSMRQLALPPRDNSANKDTHAPCAYCVMMGENRPAGHRVEDCRKMKMHLARDNGPQPGHQASQQPRAAASQGGGYPGAPAPALLGLPSPTPRKPQCKFCNRWWGTCTSNGVGNKPEQQCFLYDARNAEGGLPGMKLDASRADPMKVGHRFQGFCYEEQMGGHRPPRMGFKQFQAKSVGEQTMNRLVGKHGNL